MPKDGVYSEEELTELRGKDSESLTDEEREVLGIPPKEPEPPPPPPEPPKEPTDEDDEDQLTKTRLGRRIKKMGERMVTKEDFQSFLEKIDERIDKIDKRRSDLPLEEGDDDPIISTAADVRRVLQKEKDQEMKMRKNYIDRYTSTIARLRVEKESDEDFDEDDLKKVEELVTTDKRFYLTYSDHRDPDGDADEVLKGKLKISRKPTNKFEGKPPAAPLNPSGTGETPVKKVEVKLDDMSRVYLSKVMPNATDDELREMLGE